MVAMRALESMINYLRQVEASVKERLVDKENSLSIDQVPAEFHEPFIYTGYRRANSSIRECARSLFYLNNNESINFWTHFLPFVYTLWQLVKLSYNYSNIYNDDFMWPLFIYLLTVCFYLLNSSIAHALNCMSPIARHVFFILDYMSISMYGMGCSIVYKAYTMVNMDNTANHNVKLFDSYVLVAMCLSVTGNIMSCSSRFILNKKKRSLFRTVPFLLQYMFVSMPLFYRFLFYYYPAGLQQFDFLFSLFSSGELSSNSTVSKKVASLDNNFTVDERAATMSQSFRSSNINDYYYFFFVNKSDFYYLVQFVTAGMSAVLYVFHVPERFWPGKFDLIGQSHQLFHLTTFLCTWSQFQALKCDMNKFVIDNFHMSQFFQLDNEYLVIKDLESENAVQFGTFRYSNMPFFEIKLTYSFIFFLSFLFNVFIFIYYYRKAVYNNPWKKHKRNAQWYTHAKHDNEDKKHH